MAKPLVEKLRERFYQSEDHPFQIYEKKIRDNLQPSFTLLDAGCGANAPVLRKFIGAARTLIGVDLVDFSQSDSNEGMILINSDISKMQFADASVDLVISRSVLEHVIEIEEFYAEISRVLSPGGKFIFLVPNFYDYVSLLSYMIPNSMHRVVVEKFTGRPAEDVFPTYYSSNTAYSISRLSAKTGFSVHSIEYLGQYPYMFEFSVPLFVMGMAYDKLISRYSAFKYLRGWILAELIKKR